MKRFVLTTPTVRYDDVACLRKRNDMNCCCVEKSSESRHRTVLIKVLYEQTRELTHDFLDYV